VTGRPAGDIKTVTTPVEAGVAIFSDRGSTPLASTIPIRKGTVIGVFFAFSYSMGMVKPHGYRVSGFTDSE
jgi:hypothetical protein